MSISYMIIERYILHNIFHSNDDKFPDMQDAVKFKMHSSPK